MPDYNVPPWYYLGPIGPIRVGEVSKTIDKLLGIGRGFRFISPSGEGLENQLVEFTKIIKPKPKFRDGFAFYNGEIVGAACFPNEYEIQYIAPENDRFSNWKDIEAAVFRIRGERITPEIIKKAEEKLYHKIAQHNLLQDT